jgi:hypothetical protein
MLIVAEANAAGEGPPDAQARSAEAPAELSPKQRSTAKTFYGWQILATGEVGSLMAASSVLLPPSPLGGFPATVSFIVGMPIYTLGGPIVHWTHGNFNKGLISFGGNVGFFFVGGLSGQAIRCAKTNPAPNCGERGFFTGFAIAILIAPVLDAAILGWEDVPFDDFTDGQVLGGTSRPRAHRTTFSLAPTWSVGPRGSIEVGVSGRF